MIIVVVPAYNEQEKIGRVVRGLFEHGWRSVVVVDDGSSDGTADAARAAGAIAISHPINRGQGAALETGDQYAFAQGAQAVVHFDGDGQFNPADIAPSLTKMRSVGAQAVLGSRFLDARSRVPALKRYVILPLARGINFLFTGVLLSDAHNGFRILSSEALSAIHISQDGMAHNTEIVRQIKQKNLSYCECAVEVKYFEFGQGIVGGLRILRDLIFSLFID